MRLPYGPANMAGGQWPPPAAVPSQLVSALAGSASTLVELHDLPLVGEQAVGLAAFTRLRVLTLRQASEMRALPSTLLPASLEDLTLISHLPTAWHGLGDRPPHFTNCDRLRRLRRITLAEFAHWSLASPGGGHGERHPAPFPQSLEVRAPLLSLRDRSSADPGCAATLLDSCHAEVPAMFKSEQHEIWSLPSSRCDPLRMKCAAMTESSALQVFRVRYSQELKLIYGSKFEARQEAGSDKQPAHQPLPDPTGITLDAGGYSVHLESHTGLDCSAGVRCSLSAGCPFVFPHGPRSLPDWRLCQPHRRGLPTIPLTQPRSRPHPDCLMQMVRWSRWAPARCFHWAFPLSTWRAIDCIAWKSCGRLAKSPHRRGSLRRTQCSCCAVLCGSRRSATTVLNCCQEPVIIMSTAGCLKFLAASRSFIQGRDESLLGMTLTKQYLTAWRILPL